MIFVPRIAKLTLVSLAVVGLCAPVFARGILPGNGGSTNLTLLPALPAQDALSSTDIYSGYDELEQRFGVQNGRLDFFSVRPDDSGGFKPLLRGGIGDGGLQLQMKW
jgi:hypothetical protein